VATHIAFDPPLSRRIYAGVDFFFVPSRFEPCGLTQMYAMRYGAIPIVTNVGGLHDTVEPIGEVDGVERGTGFVTERPDVDALRVATQAAFALYADRDALARASVRGMTKDFSWTSPARQYQALFHRLNLASTTFLASD
jgi:starch synthase